MSDYEKQSEIMTRARAKEVLKRMGSKAGSTDILYVYNRMAVWTEEAELRGFFKLEELQAIALWMQDPEGVTNANQQEKRRV